MAIRNHNIDSKIIRVLVFLWFLGMSAGAIYFLVKSVHLIMTSGGLGGGVVAAFLFVCALLCATLGAAPYIYQSVDWFSEWFVIGLLWTHAHNKEPGDPVDPICRLIEQGRYLEARVGLEKLLANNPKNYGALFVLAELLAVYMNDEATAFQLLHEHFTSGRSKRKPMPDNIPALLLFADLAERAGRPQEAVHLLQQECRLRYTSEERQQLLDRIAELTSKQ